MRASIVPWLVVSAGRILPVLRWVTGLVDMHTDSLIPFVFLVLSAGRFYVVFFLGTCINNDSLKKIFCESKKNDA